MKRTGGKRERTKQDYGCLDKHTPSRSKKRSQRKDNQGRLNTGLVQGFNLKEVDYGEEKKET